MASQSSVSSRKSSRSPGHQRKIKWGTEAVRQYVVDKHSLPPYDLIEPEDI